MDGIIRFEHDFYRAIQEVENVRTKNKVNILKIIVFMWSLTLIVWWFKS